MSLEGDADVGGATHPAPRRVHRGEAEGTGVVRCVRVGRSVNRYRPRASLLRIPTSGPLRSRRPWRTPGRRRGTRSTWTVAGTGIDWPSGSFQARSQIPGSIPVRGALSVCVPIATCSRPATRRWPPPRSAGMARAWFPVVRSQTVTTFPSRQGPGRQRPPVGRQGPDHLAGRLLRLPADLAGLGVPTDDRPVRVPGDRVIVRPEADERLAVAGEEQRRCRNGLVDPSAFGASSVRSFPVPTSISRTLSHQPNPSGQRPAVRADGPPAAGVGRHGGELGLGVLAHVRQPQDGQVGGRLGSAGVEPAGGTAAGARRGRGRQIASPSIVYPTFCSAFGSGPVMSHRTRPSLPAVYRCLSSGATARCRTPPGPCGVQAAFGRQPPSREVPPCRRAPAAGPRSPAVR